MYLKDGGAAVGWEQQHWKKHTEVTVDKEYTVQYCDHLLEDIKGRSILGTGQVITSPTWHW